MPKRKRQNQPCKCDLEKDSADLAGAVRRFWLVELWKKLNNSAAADFYKQVKVQDEASEKIFGSSYTIVRDGVKILLKLTLSFVLLIPVTYLISLASPNVQEVLTLIVDLLKASYAGKTAYPFLKNLISQSKQK